MDMPAEAQALYFHLCMAADDDGFCDNPRSIMRACGASNDSMKLLIGKKFVLTFEKNDGFIVVVKHWRLNNYIRKDTYHETKYKEFMRELYFDENQSYSMNPGDGHVPCLPKAFSEPVTPSSRTRHEPVTDPSRIRDDPLTQDSIGKDKANIGEERKGKGESEGGNPTPESFPQPDVEKPVENSKLRRAQIAAWRKRVDFLVKMGQDPGYIYDNARMLDGITKDEIDNYEEENHHE